MAFEEIEGPLGPRRGDYHAAMLAAVFANGVSALSGKRGSKKVGDFLLQWDRPRHQSPEEMLRMIQSWNRHLGGEEVKRG